MRAAVHPFGRGRSVYLAGLPYSTDNARLLHRALHWAAGRDADFGDWVAEDPRVEVAHYPQSGQFVALNNATEPVHTTVRGDGRTRDVSLNGRGHAWVRTSEDAQ